MSGLSKKELHRLKTFGSKGSRQQERGVLQSPRASYTFEADRKNRDLLLECWRDWTNMEPIREEHRRNQRYKNNKQWEDPITDPENPNRTITERENISRRGRTPLSNNLIDPTVRNIHGQMLSNPTKPVVVSRTEDDTQLGEMLTNALQKALQLNRYSTTKVSILESLLSSGYCIGKVRYGYWYTKNKTDVKIDFVSINRFFFNQDAEDPRLEDIYRCGEIHDLTWQQLVRDFNVVKHEERILKEQYTYQQEDPLLHETAENNIRNMDFYGVANSGKYRVFEVWTKKNRQVEYVHDPVRGEEIYDEINDSVYYDRENTIRRSQMMALGMTEEEIAPRLIVHKPIVEAYWEAKWLTPQGVCLKVMETPYEHQSHPYVISCMPRIDGVAKPILSNLCEIQRTANRHLTMIDFALAQSAKGLLLVPQSVLGNMTLEDFARAWTRTDGVIAYDDSNPNSRMPTQISTNPIPAGAFDFLRTEWEALKEVSGLSGALQGQVSRAGTPSSLYAQQAQNSMLNFVLVFDCFKEFNTMLSEKALQVIMQYYNTRRHVDISGQSYSETAMYYEPEMIDKIVEWNVVIADSTDTPVFRQVADDFLKYLFEAQAINIEMLLENSSMPFAQKLLAQIRSAQQTAQQGGDWAAQVQGMELPQEVQGTSPQSLQAMKQLYNSMQDANMMQGA
jgi:hypothetical protein